LVRSSRGFTLIELLVGLGVLGILLGLAAPSMITMMQNNRMASASNDLMSDLAAARSEAARRGQRIVFCKNSGDNVTCNAAAPWESGWLAFIDINSNGALDAGTDIMFRVRQPLPAGITVTPAGGITNTLTATPIGLVTPQGTFKLCDSRTGNFGRLITVAATGRASSAATSCP
jgi:type IV fimbrial biogenesis protein FimT